MTDPSDWLPNLFIAGVPKAGTSSLHRWIADHPDALGSTEKEACFFVDPGSHVFRPEANARDGIEGYRAQFNLPTGARPRVILESTPTYIYQRTALEMIPDLPTQPRCVFVVREPSEQIRSVYTYYRNNWTYIPADLDFEGFLTAVRNGSARFGGNELAERALANARYIGPLRAWKARLGGGRMLVCTFDELRSDARGLTRRIAAWAGLDPAFYDTYAFPAENETYTPRSRGLQRINVALRARLPKGAAYRALRHVYRRMNTSKGSETVAPADRLAALAAEFADDNAALAAEFGLTLPGWPQSAKTSE